MKRYIVSLSILVFTALSFSYTSALSITKSGDVITEYNPDLISPLASLTKLMNIAVALDMVKDNKASLDDLVLLNSYERNMKESSISVKANQKIRLETLLQAELVYSANNAAYAVARHLAGTYDNYVKLMNNKAMELGMENTVFYTPAGLPSSYTNKPLDISNSYDLVKLVDYLVKNSQVLEWAKLKSISINNIKYPNRNKILNTDGNYGLKTGYHSKSGYNMIGLFNINGIDLYNITLGDTSETDRFNNQLSLANKFKDSFELLIKKGDVYAMLPITNSKSSEIEAVFSKDFYFYTKNLLIDEIIYPLDKEVHIGDKVGEIRIYQDYILIDSIDLLSNTEAKPLNLLDKIFNKLKL